MHIVGSLDAVCIMKHTCCASVLCIILWRNQLFLTQVIQLVEKKVQRDMQEETKTFADVTFCCCDRHVPKIPYLG